MQYKLYLKPRPPFITTTGEWAELYENHAADIMYLANKDDAEINEGIKIGTIVWATYNQDLAVNNHVRLFISPATRHLQYPDITKETIDEIGAPSHPNIVMLTHFGISAAYSNKGLGEEVLNLFIAQMKRKCGYILIEDNIPAQFDNENNINSFYETSGVDLDSLDKDREKAQYKLNAFWQRCGFKLFKDYNNVFILNVERAEPKVNINKSNSISQEL